VLRKIYVNHFVKVISLNTVAGMVELRTYININMLKQ